MCAAQIAGLIHSGNSDEHGGRIHALTKGEASLYFCSSVLESDSESLSSFPLLTVMTLKKRSIMPNKLCHWNGVQGVKKR